MDMEEWREVEEHPGYYISNQNGWRRNGKESKGIINKGGYRLVSIGNDRKKGFHILVAKAFPEICGEWFDGCHVHHINHDTLDNRPENLVIISASEHSKLHYKEQPDTFKKPSTKRNASISRALTGRRAVEKHTPVIQLTKNNEFVRRWDCITDVQKELGYSAGNICWCCRGKIKTAYGYIWRYAV